MTSGSVQQKIESETYKENLDVLDDNTTDENDASEVIEDKNKPIEGDLLADYNKLAKDLLRTMRITTNARFEASKRLRTINSICFLSTTLASLGLILIPLLDIAGHNKVFTSNSLTVFQIFLAVCVLVYSATISTANFSVRSKEFLECGDKIKAVVNEFKSHLMVCKHEKKIPLVSKYTDTYTELLVGTENHEDVGYLKALNLYNKKENPNNNSYVGIFTRIISFLKMYLPFVVLMFLEIVFIGDMLGYWSILSAFHKEQQEFTYVYLSNFL